MTSNELALYHSMLRQMAHTGNPAPRCAICGSYSHPTSQCDVPNIGDVVVFVGCCILAAILLLVI